VQGDAGMGIAARIDDRPIGIVDMRLEEVDQSALVVRLEGLDGIAQLGGTTFQPRVYGRQRDGAINARFAPPQQIQVRPAYHQNAPGPRCPGIARHLDLLPVPGGPLVSGDATRVPCACRAVCPDVPCVQQQRCILVVLIEERLIRWLYPASIPELAIAMAPFW